MDTQKVKRILEKITTSCASYFIILVPGVIFLFINRIKRLTKPPQIKNFAIICYAYGIETSPFVKSLCSYFYDKGYGSADVFIDSLGRTNLSSQKGIHVIKFNSLIFNSLNRFSFIDKKLLYFFLLKLYCNECLYRFVFAIDYQSLNFLQKISFPLEKVIYLSLEGTDYMRLFTRSAVLRVLPKCKALIIASQERGKEISDFLNIDLNFIYFPISLRPETENSKLPSSNLKIVYSGYFADFSALNIFIDTYIISLQTYKTDLYLHGHFYGQDEYFEVMKSKVKFQDCITIDTSYYSDDQHHDFLSNFDIGIAFYLNISGTDNFENLIFSSGKIAAYLWAGLAVMTNIDCELTKMYPFIYIKDFNLKSFLNGIQNFQNSKEEFRRSALNLARTKYNFDTYMDEIFGSDVFPVLTRNN